MQQNLGGKISHKQVKNSMVVLYNCALKHLSKAKFFNLICENFQVCDTSTSCFIVMQENEMAK